MTVKKTVIRRKVEEEEFSPVKIFESKPNSALPLLRCQFCNAEWIPRKNFPVECPACKRRGWYSPTAKHTEEDFE